METVTAYTDVEQQLVIATAIKKKDDKVYDDKVTEKHFVLRNYYIQSYFIRLSSEYKKMVILKFVKQLKSPASIFQIFSVMSLGHAKMDFYAAVNPETNFVHDKLLLDHNRTMESKTLEETIANDLEWFANVDDSRQINLTMGLIRISGGTVKRNLYLPLYKIYRNQLCGLMLKHFDVSNKSTSLTYEALLEDESEYDPKHPATIEVIKQRKRWMDLMTKYRDEVTPDPNKPIDKEKEKKKKDKSDKKKRHKGFKDEYTVMKEVDLIQLLPIWIVKKIFTYFSNKDLVKLKKINSYWSFAISELIKERNARTKLDAALEKMNANIDLEVFEKAMQPSKKKLVQPTHQKVFYELGATAQKLLPKNLPKLEEKSLSLMAKRDRHEDFDLPTGEFVPFPRFIEKDIELYRFRPGFLQDVGVRFDIDEEMQKQKSFLTYSLVRSVSGIKITVEEDVLNDW